MGTVLDVNQVHLGRRQPRSPRATCPLLAPPASRFSTANWQNVVPGLPAMDPLRCNWGAGVVWFGRRDRLLNGSDLRVGDAVVGLAETGCRSNGYTLLRQILQREHGDDWHAVPSRRQDPGRSRTTAVAHFHARAVVDMLGGVEGEPQVVLAWGRACNRRRGCRGSCIGCCGAPIWVPISRHRCHPGPLLTYSAGARAG